MYYTSPDTNAQQHLAFKPDHILSAARTLADWLQTDSGLLKRTISDSHVHVHVTPRGDDIGKVKLIHVDPIMSDTHISDDAIRVLMSLVMRVVDADTAKRLDRVLFHLAARLIASRCVVWAFEGYTITVDRQTDVMTAEGV
jgi:hypothetical protein